MTLESNEHTHKDKIAEVSKTNMIEEAKALSYNQNFILHGLFFPCPVLYTFKIMVLLNNFSSEATWPVSVKFQVDNTVEMRFRVCSNSHAPLTIMPIYGKKKT